MIHWRNETEKNKSYGYVFNNPLRFIDPTGMMGDWNQSDKKKDVEWIDGNPEQEGYTHIGTAGKILNTNGDRSRGINLNADESATNIETGSSASKSLSGRINITTKSDVDGGAINATIGLIGGVAEVALGAVSIETGVEVFGIVDGVSRVGLNATRLGGYLTKNKEFGDALPGNIGGLAGKMIDGKGFYNNGPVQKIMGFGNDAATLILTGTSWGATPSVAATVAGAVSDGYTLGFYYNQAIKHK